jgi:hypothetical protein
MFTIFSQITKNGGFYVARFVFGSKVYEQILERKNLESILCNQDRIVNQPFLENLDARDCENLKNNIKLINEVLNN